LRWGEIAGEFTPVVGSGFNSLCKQTRARDTAVYCEINTFRYRKTGVLKYQNNSSGAQSLAKLRLSKLSTIMLGQQFLKFLFDIYLIIFKNKNTRKFINPWSNDYGLKWARKYLLSEL